MSHLLNRFSLHVAPWNPFVPLALVLVWIAVLCCIISSILTQPFDSRQRVFWIGIVVLLPGIGLLAYLPFAFKKDDLPMMFRRRTKRNKATAAHSSQSDHDA